MKTRPRLRARHVAMAAAVLWLLMSCVLAAMPGPYDIRLFMAAPLIAATAADERCTAIFAGSAVVLTTIAAGSRHGLAAACATGLLAVVLARLRRRREERLARMTAIAEASQLALLPPLPPEMTGIGIAGPVPLCDARGLGRG